MLGKFEKVHIEITNVCNLSCSFCPQIQRPKKLMDLEMFSMVIEQVAPLTKQVALHLMGDPLLHPKLEEMVDICDRFNVKIFFVTNGVLLKSQRAEVLLRPAFRQVNFSLHSFHDNYGAKDPSEYLGHIFQFTKRAFAERPDLYINYRLWNLKDVRSDTALNSEMLDRVGEFFGVPVPKDVDVCQQKSHRLLNRLYLHFDTEFVWPSLDLPVIGESGRCYGLKSHFGILSDGTVVPCCLDKDGAIALGNVADQKIADVLMGAKARGMIKGFQERRLVESLCQRCNYIERFN